MEQFNTTNFTNPYYSDEPFLSTYPIKINVCLTTIIGVILIYCCFLKPAEVISLSWKRFIILHIFLGMILQINIAFFSFPMFLLPYVAIHFNGILSDYGASQVFQNSLTLSILFANVSIIFPLFYLRMVYLLQNDGHFLKSKPAMIFGYFIFYFLPVVVPFPSLYSIYEDPEPLKLFYFKKYRVVYPDIFKKDVFFLPDSVHSKSNQPLFMIGSVVLIYASTIVISIWVTLRIIRRHQQQTRSRTSFREVKFQLIFLAVTCFYAIPTVAVPAGLCFILDQRADIYVLAIFNGAILINVVLASILIMIKPLRMGFLSLVWKKKSPPPNAVASSTN